MIDIYNYTITDRGEYAPGVEIGYSFDISGYASQGELRESVDVWYIDKQKAYEGLKAQGETKDWKIESPDDINGFLEDYLIDEIKDAFMDGLRGDYYGEIESVREQMYNNAMKGISW